MFSHQNVHYSRCYFFPVIVDGNWLIYIRSLQFGYLILVSEVLSKLRIVLPEFVEFLHCNRPILLSIKNLKNKFFWQKLVIHFVFLYYWLWNLFFYFRLSLLDLLLFWRQGWTIFNEKIFQIRIFWFHRNAHRSVTFIINLLKITTFL